MIRVVVVVAIAVAVVVVEEQQVTPYYDYDVVEEQPVTPYYDYDVVDEKVEQWQWLLSSKQRFYRYFFFKPKKKEADVKFNRSVFPGRKKSKNWGANVVIYFL